MVRKKVVEVRGGGSGDNNDSKRNPDKSVGKELLKRVRAFKERGSGSKK